MVVGKRSICSEDWDGEETENLKSKQNLASEHLEMCVRGPNFCVNAAWLRSDLESGRLCKGKQNGHSRLGVKCCYPYVNLNFLQRIFAHMNSVLL